MHKDHDENNKHDNDYDRKDDENDREEQILAILKNMGMMTLTTIQDTNADDATMR